MSHAVRLGARYVGRQLPNYDRNVMLKEDDGQMLMRMMMNMMMMMMRRMMMRRSKKMTTMSKRATGNDVKIVDNSYDLCYDCDDYVNENVTTNEPAYAMSTLDGRWNDN